jgi:lipopolysaccharide/colanic/teichoic acid biosynthesis glycosyltransferase
MSVDVTTMAELTSTVSRPGPATSLARRAIDVTIAGTALLVLVPVIAVAAIAVRLSSPGPVLFRQRRLGRHMQPFTVLKFRTMRADADSALHRDYVRSLIGTQPPENAPDNLYKLVIDPRVTRVGRFLRSWSLDEVPQLWNVLRGEMSLVGPRPCIPYELEHFRPYQLERFLVPQGITGLWQVTARANSTFGEALDMDVAYVRGWSLGLDLRLLLRTPFELLRQRKATA